MKAKFAVRLALVAIALVALTVAATADTKVTITVPADGSTVHGLVAIQATKTDPLDGWISLRILPVDHSYLAATVAPVNYQWDTQQRDDAGRLQYRDGQYTIEATAYDGSGRLEDRTSVQVTVANAIPASEFGGKVLLRLKLQRADAFAYKLDITQVVDVPGRAGSLLRTPPATGAMGGMPGMGMGGMGMGGPPMAPGGMGGPGASGPGGASGGRVLNFSPGLDVAVPVNNSADPSWNARFQNVGAAWVDQRQHGPGTGDVAVFVWPKPITPAGIPSNIAMSGTALWTLDVLSPSATGLAIADDDLNYGSYKVTWHWPKTTDENGASETDVPDSFVGWLPGPLLARPSEGESYRVKIAPDGIIVPMRTREAMVISDPDAGGHLIAGVKPFPFAHFFIQLPTEPVGAGDTWQGSMGVIQGLTDLLVRLVDGVTFKLEDFEYRGTHRCARITATYTESGVKIPWEMPALGSAKGPALTAGPGGSVSGNPLSALTGALNTYAGQMNAAMNGTDFPTGSMPLGGPPGAPAGPGAMGPGGGQTSAVGPDGEPQGTLKGDITVRRTVYFDLDDGRFLSFDDAITKKITKILAPPESQGMGMGMGAGMGMGMSSSTTTKLDYRDLTSTDVQPLMGQLVGAGGTGSGQGGPGGGGPGGPGGMPMPGGFMPGMGGPPMGGMPMGGPPMGGGMGGGMPGAAAVPSVKATISITTNLSLTEIGQVAGHAVSPY